MSKIIITLDKILDELNITKNKLAVEAKLRPNLITELTEGKSKAIKFETLIKILDTINSIAIIKNIGKTYRVEDLIYYEFENL
ncbi:helix-turn-helix domain-containing protein [Heyndrickxia oleronia]|uniref:helix-turn-helix domain-containing protein n=1 Tax=Heyndrickxia oleronia TaxID=38875 RepID=UPI00242DA527|nr:helix-turn-helix domain-containing protein [Heyndrickxia oleronia]MCI1763628.1 helix-turn-helix domain-containing protein [Heyndrickxia oleronia]